MEALAAANRGGAHAYGGDEVSRKLDEEMARAFGPRARAHLVFTGTAANVLSVSLGRLSHHAVICADVAHLNESEGGAPERFTGGKLLTVPSRDGRIFPADIKPLLCGRGDQHRSQPKWVSLTQPTEFGVCFSLVELRELGQFCGDQSLMLHIDGARLPAAAARLGCSLADLTVEIGAHAVSFGGTKNGLMGAEAVVVFDKDLAQELKYVRKQAMQLPSKSRFLAAQFYAFLKDDLWLELARATNARALRLAEALAEFPNVRLAHPVETNALFVELPTAWLKPLREHVFFYVWDRPRGLARWVLGWDWTDDDSDALIARLRELTAADNAP
jgi:threonine aldolase